MTPNKYEERILGYIDVLGWSSLINQSTTDQAIITELLEALDLTRRDLENQPHLHLVQVTHFSDHVCISCPATMKHAIAAISIVLGSMTLKLLEKGFPVRGALVAGPLIHSGTRILGPALIEAHEIESRVAKYPRIVLSDRAVGYALLCRDDRLFPQDADGLTFLDVFAPLDTDEEIEAIRTAIVKRGAMQETLDFRSKKCWLLNQLRRRQAALKSA